MKKSIAFLPKKNREDLKYLVELILDGKSTQSSPLNSQ